MGVSNIQGQEKGRHSADLLLENRYQKIFLKLWEPSKHIGKVHTTPKWFLYSRQKVWIFGAVLSNSMHASHF